MAFSLSEIEQAAGGEILAPAGAVCARVSIDSRRVQPGDLFVAIPGERFDGHNFISDAVSAGASAIVTSRPVQVPPGIGVVLVRDTVAALGALARHHRRQFALPVVAVTGSTGKTTVKEMIASLGAVRHRVAKTVGNRNNEIGLPLTLLDLSPADELLVVEMGMRGPGQIASLASIAEPRIGVVTNIGLTHLELLGTQEAIAAAKGELLAALPREGTAILNADDPFYRRLAEGTRASILSFGFSAGASVRAVGVETGGDGSAFEIQGPGWLPFIVRLRVPGEHQVRNALAAAAVGHALGYPPAEIRAGLEAFAVEQGRGAAIGAPEGWTVIDDTYNASPASVLAALEVLRRRPAAGRRFAVLGDMLELGSAAVEGHRQVGRAAARSGLAFLLTTGELAAEIAAGAAEAGFPPTMTRHYPDKDRLLADLRRLLRPGDLILVKGSRGMRLEEVVAGLTHQAPHSGEE